MSFQGLRSPGYKGCIHPGRDKEIMKRTITIRALLSVTSRLTSIKAVLLFLFVFLPLYILYADAVIYSWYETGETGFVTDSQPDSSHKDCYKTTFSYFDASSKETIVDYSYTNKLHARNEKVALERSSYGYYRIANSDAGVYKSCKVRELTIIGIGTLYVLFMLFVVYAIFLLKTWYIFRNGSIVKGRFQKDSNSSNPKLSYQLNGKQYLVPVSLRSSISRYLLYHIQNGLKNNDLLILVNPNQPEDCYPLICFDDIIDVNQDCAAITHKKSNVRINLNDSISFRSNLNQYAKLSLYAFVIVTVLFLLGCSPRLPDYLPIWTTEQSSPTVLNSSLDVDTTLQEEQTIYINRFTWSDNAGAHTGTCYSSKKIDDKNIQLEKAGGYYRLRGTHYFPPSCRYLKLYLCLAPFLLLLPLLTLVYSRSGAGNRETSASRFTKESPENHESVK